jgi:hypothetical protein
VRGRDRLHLLGSHISHPIARGRDSMVRDSVAWEQLEPGGLQKAVGSVPNALASLSVGMMDLPLAGEQEPSLEVAQVSLLERRQVQRRRKLAEAHYSHVVSTPSADVHNCASCHLFYHRGNVSDRESVCGVNVNVCGRGDRVNGFDGDLGRRCWQSGCGIGIPRGRLLHLADVELLVCSSDVDL